MRTIPIPGEILNSTVVFGLTFDELVVLGSLPVVLILPSLFIEQIPMIVSGGLAVVFFLGTVLVAVRTPDGQTPLEWGPAAFKRRFSPNAYYLKPEESDRERAVYSDVVHTVRDADDGEDRR